jgi:hypothetical protein
MTNTATTNAQNKQIESNNLKVIQDQIGYESLLTKKCNEYATMCTDQALKSLCTQASKTHKQNFDSLKTYLDSHQ